MRVGCEGCGVCVRGVCGCVECVGECDGVWV